MVKPVVITSHPGYRLPHRPFISRGCAPTPYRAFNCLTRLATRKWLPRWRRGRSQPSPPLVRSQTRSRKSAVPTKEGRSEAGTDGAFVTRGSSECRSHNNHRSAIIMRCRIDKNWYTAKIRYIIARYDATACRRCKSCVNDTLSGNNYFQQMRQNVTGEGKIIELFFSPHSRPNV